MAFPQVGGLFSPSATLSKTGILERSTLTKPADFGPGRTLRQGKFLSGLLKQALASVPRECYGCWRLATLSEGRKTRKTETRTETSIMSDRGSGRCQAKLG